MVATSTVLASLLSIFSLQSAAGLGVIVSLGARTFGLEKTCADATRQLPLYIYPTDGAWDNLYSA